MRTTYLIVAALCVLLLLVASNLLRPSGADADAVDMTRPGNYVVANAAGGCELRVVPSNGRPAYSVPLERCTPSVPDGRLTMGFRAMSPTCGPLVFSATTPGAVTALFTDKGAQLVCDRCGIAATGMWNDCPMKVLESLFWHVAMQ